MSVVQSQYSYQVGGSLSPYSSCYVERHADEQLFRSLTQGEFCYVFNSRQMGKSSLRVRITQRLRAADVHCGVIDITEIGSQNLTPDQWYASVVLCLTNSFDLSINLGEWWRDRLYLSPVKRLDEFVDQVLLTQIEGDIVVFIDEIDSVLGLDFSVEDFFALIRSWYNQRTESPNYQRLTLALFGVATPSELIADHQRTPFNVGRAIALDGFQLQDAQPLLPGLASLCTNPEDVLNRILYWTGGQPFLTQKLCQLMLDGTGTMQAGSSTTASVAYGLSLGHSGTLSVLTSEDIDKLVYARILTNWEALDEPEHLKTIRDYLLSNEYRAGRLLGLYQSVLENDSIPLDDSSEQMELLLSGLVMKLDGHLTIRNRIYREIFNQDWVNQQLNKLRPYAPALTAWLQSDGRDESRLLRGQALQEAQAWSSLHSLSDQDYQFLTASQQLEQRQTQQRLNAEKLQAIEAQLATEAARAQETEARLVAETKSAKRQRWFLMAVSVGLVLTSTLGITTVFQYRRAIENQQQAELREIEAIATSAEALLSADQQLDAIVEAIRVNRRMEELNNPDKTLQIRAEQILRHSLLEGVESNRFSGHRSNVQQVAISPDGQQIATAGSDNSVKLWDLDGTLLNTLDGGHVMKTVTFSPDGEWIIAGGLNDVVNIWNRDGTRIRDLEGHTNTVQTVAISPDSQLVASGSHDNTIKLWHMDGTLMATLDNHQAKITHLAFSPNGQQLASVGEDNTIRLWLLDGTETQTVQENGRSITGLTFSADGQMLISSTTDAISLRTMDGMLIQRLEGGGHHVTVSPDGHLIAAIGDDHSIKRWTMEGLVLEGFRPHGDRTTNHITFSPDGQFLVSASNDRTARLWRMKHTPQVHLHHPTWTRDVAFSPDGQWLATASEDQHIYLWETDGALKSKLPGHEDFVNGVAISPNGEWLASSSDDGTVRLWQSDGTPEKILPMDRNGVFTATFSSDGERLMATDWDGLVRLWNLDGEVLWSQENEGDGVGSVFSPNDQLIATVGQNFDIQIWTQDGTFVQTLQGHEDWVSRLAFSPDGQRLVSASADYTLKIWDIQTGQIIRSLNAHDNVIRALAVSSDSQLIASGGDDEQVKLWSWEGILLATLPKADSVWSLAFHPDNNQLAWTGRRQVSILYDLEQILDTEKLLDAGCRWIKDYLQTNINVDEGDRQLCDGINRSNE